MNNSNNYIFLTFFLKAYYIVFLSHHTADANTNPNPMPTPIESVMNMFLMSLSNFGDIFGEFDKTEHEYVAKVTRIHNINIRSLLEI